MQDETGLPLEKAANVGEYVLACEKTREAAAAAHKQHADNLPMWVVFGPGTLDHPGAHLARLWTLRPDGKPTDVLVRAATLAEVRGLLPPGLACLPRHHEDDPNIIEVWI